LYALFDFLSARATFKRHV